MLRLCVFLFLSACAATPRTVPLVVIQSPAEKSQYMASGEKFILAAQGQEAGKAAKVMFDAGGNIIDAAIAASFVISVERPQSTGLGGGGFLLYREAKSGKVYAIDFRERAPLRASRDMYLDAKGEVIPDLSLNGIKSVATPGLVAGLLEIHAKFGTLPLEKIMAPAVELAENGLLIYPHLANSLKKRAAVLAKYPASRAIFLKKDGTPYLLGEKIFQKDLAKSLRLIAKNGARGFYHGEIAQKILVESKRLGGILSEADFLKYKVKWREPLHGSFQGYELYSMPPPSSGGIHVLEILNILENDPLRDFGFFSTKSIHLTAAASQLAFADRSKYPGDPDFIKVPVDKLISKKYAADLRSKISDFKANSSKDILPGKLDSLDTTHFSIMDKDGNMVSATETIDYLFGSGVVVPGTGIMLNDEMDDFSVKPGAQNVFGAVGGDANAIAPGKTPLSSMSPSLVLKDGVPVMAVGAPGGTRIISCVAETLLNYLQYKMPVYEAVAAPRIHHQWIPDVLDIDLPGPGDEVLKDLKNMGYAINLEKDAVPCRVEAVVKEAGRFFGAADPRDLGISVGE